MTQQTAPDVTLVEGTVTFNGQQFKYFGDSVENDEQQIRTLEKGFDLYLNIAKNLEVDTTSFIKSIPETSSIVGYIGLILREIRKITKDTY